MTLKTPGTAKSCVSREYEMEHKQRSFVPGAAGATQRTGAAHGSEAVAVEAQQPDEPCRAQEPAGRRERQGGAHDGGARDHLCAAGWQRRGVDDELSQRFGQLMGSSI